MNPLRSKMLVPIPNASGSKKLPSKAFHAARLSGPNNCFMCENETLSIARISRSYIWVIKAIVPQKLQG